MRALESIYSLQYNKICNKQKSSLLTHSFNPNPFHWSIIPSIHPTPNCSEGEATTVARVMLTKEKGQRATPTFTIFLLPCYMALTYHVDSTIARSFKGHIPQKVLGGVKNDSRGLPLEGSFVHNRHCNKGAFWGREQIYAVLF